jgi:hypothetical protein
MTEEQKRDYVDSLVETFIASDKFMDNAKKKFREM